MLRESAALAASTGAYWQTHLSEDHDELDEVARLFPEAIDYLDVYDRAGGLGPRTILAHSIHLSDREVARLAETDTAVAHCPASNLFLSSGAMPLSHYLAHGIRVGLGSDVSAGPELSIFANMRAGAYTQSGLHVLADGRGPEPLDPLDWLRLGTIGGARALGLQAEIGSLEAGKEADMIAVDPRLVAPGRGHRLGRPGRDHVPARVPPPPGHGPARLGPRAGARRPAGGRVTSAASTCCSRAARSSTAPARRACRAGWRSTGSRIVLPGADEAVEAARVIDVTGHVVAPGFIDLHSHGGLVILAEPRHEPKVRQGVTTELIGVDGNGYAPFPDPQDLADFVVLNAGLDGRPDIAFDWATVAEQLDRYDGRVSVNVATVVGNTPLRIAALGWDEVAADAAAIADQRARLREAMEDGAFGLSTGLDYPPGAYATTEELAAIAEVAAELGGIYHTHVRYPLGDGFLDPFREAIEIGRRSGAPAHITHFYHRATFPGPPEQMLALVDDAPRRGARRLVRPVPVRVGEHAAADHAADVDPGRRDRAAEGAPRGRARCAPGSATRCGRGGACSPATARGTSCGSGR